MKKIFYPLFILVVVFVCTSCVKAPDDIDIPVELYVMNSSEGLKICLAEDCLAIEIEFEINDVAKLDAIEINPDLMDLRKLSDSGILLALVYPGRMMAKGEILFSTKEDLLATIKTVKVVSTDSMDFTIRKKRGTSPSLLGDFQPNDTVNIQDFLLFAQNYNTTLGHAGYDVTYDIGPAQDVTQGDWAGIYDVALPDGSVNLTDFVVFAGNYGKTKPADINQSPSTPQNQSPHNNAQNISTSPTLSWNPSTDPDGDAVSYEVYLATTVENWNLISTVNSTSMPINGLQNATTYYWKIIAKDTHDNRTSGETWQFTTVAAPNQPPSEPSNPSPSSGSTDQETTLTLGWNASTDADGDAVTYDVYMDTTENPETLKGNTAGTTFTVSNLNNSMQYFWKVVAKDSHGGNTAGDVWHFTTKSVPPVNVVTYRALTIGIIDYGGSDDLEYTDDDSDDIEITLERLNNAYTVQKETGRVTKAQVQSWLNNYAGICAASDVFLFHFAGHGIYSRGESKIEFSDSTKMSTSELRSLLDNINGTKIVLIDSCDSGNFSTLVIQRNASDFNDGVLRSFEENIRSRGSFDSEYEYYVLTGCKVGESSGEDDYLENGVFSFFFCDGLGDVREADYQRPYDGTFDADGYGPGGILDRNVTYRELYNYSKDNTWRFVQDAYRDNQTVQGNHTDSDFVIGVY